ncbi:MAG: M28 family peptidase [Thermoanaerobaculaceae bacterium]|jgi:hypothetical protein
MTTLALPLVAAVAALFPEARSFWVVTTGPQLQPTQLEVRARLVREGRTVAVYQEEGYHFSTLGEADETQQIEAAVNAFDKIIYPREVELFGPCPDLDGNGKVILLLTHEAGPSGLFFPFDQLLENEAVRSGFHSNQGEILYHAFGRQGNRATRNIQELAETFHRLLHYSRDPGETSWSELLANYTPYLCGLASARLLWGDIDPENRAHAPGDPWADRGWSLLFIEYLRDKFGDQGLRDLVARPEKGLAGIGRMLAERGDRRTPADLLGDFAMACWLDDPALADGRFSFASVVPPRPPAPVRATAARPTSGAIEVGVGGLAFLTVEGSGERPFPLTLQGDPSVRWVGRAVKLHVQGPDRELPLAFSPAGTVKLELPALTPAESVVVAVSPVPAESPLFDSRVLLLRWGVGWVPQAPSDQSRETLRTLVGKALPDAGAAARSRLMTTVDRLSGAPRESSEGPVVTTRYAWAPQARAVVEVLLQEANRRGLPARSSPFIQRVPNGVQQEWSNVLIELPGNDPRRWPVVLAAHWDGARGNLRDSYLRALNVNDNASGVAVALEAAAAMSRSLHRAPIIVAFLAGGYHDAAGAHALLEELGGKVSAWVELDAVGVPESWPHTLDVRLEGDKDLGRSSWSITQAFRHAGFVPKVTREIQAPHTGGSMARALGRPALVVRVGPDGQDDSLDTSPAIERDSLAPDFMVLLVKALAGVGLSLAGVP